MAGTLNPTKALIFRITHRDNLPWILHNGLYAQNGAFSDPGYRSIGNPDVIGKRTNRTVPAGTGGVLGDYIPFHFTPFSMMLYNIHTGYGVSKVPNEEIVILVSSLYRIAELGIPYVFTDQHALRRTATYFTNLAELTNIDWPLLNGRDFKYDSDNPGKTDRYQAEALIWKHMPVDALLGIASYNEEVRATLEAEARGQNKQVNTSVQRGWFFQ